MAKDCSDNAVALINQLINQANQQGTSLNDLTSKLNEVLLAVEKGNTQYQGNTDRILLKMMEVLTEVKGVEQRLGIKYDTLLPTLNGRLDIFGVKLQQMGVTNLCNSYPSTRKGLCKCNNSSTTGTTSSTSTDICFHNPCYYQKRDCSCSCDGKEYTYTDSAGNTFNFTLKDNTGFENDYLKVDVTDGIHFTFKATGITWASIKKVSV